MGRTSWTLLEESIFLVVPAIWLAGGAGIWDGGGGGGGSTIGTETERGSGVESADAGGGETDISREEAAVSAESAATVSPGSPELIE